MDSKIFFTFGSKLLESTAQVHSLGLKTDENGVDHHWNLIKGNYKGISFPVIFKQERGKIFTDILDTGWTKLYLISNKLKTVLEENNLTGWKVFPVQIYDKNGNNLLGYNGFSITGRCGSVHYNKSDIIEKRKIPSGPLSQYYKGLFVDTWDGSDFFTPDQTYQVFMTTKSAEILKKNNITNLKIENLSEKETPVCHVQKDI